MPQLKLIGIRRLVLISIAVPLICATCKSDQKSSVENSKLLSRIDSLKKLLTNTKVQIDTIQIPANDSGKIKTADTETIYIIESPKNADKSWFETPKDFIPWVLTVLGLLVGYFGFMRTSRFKSYDFLGEINKLSIANPELYAFYTREYYDSVLKRIQKDEKDDNDKKDELDLKLRAFSYFKLNNFESTFQSYWWIKKGGAFKTWKIYLDYSIDHSGIFVECANQAIDEKLFSKRFTNQLNKTLVKKGLRKTATVTTETK